MKPLNYNIKAKKKKILTHILRILCTDIKINGLKELKQIGIF